MGKLAGAALGVGGVCLMLVASGWVHADGPAAAAPPAAPKPDEAPNGYNGLTNGFEDQAAFDKDRDTFQEVEDIPKNGLGPVYNATSCVGCHQSPITGAASQIPELRVGHHIPDPDHAGKALFVEPPSGSLIHQRAVDASAQEHARPEDEVRTLRMSTNVLGNGYIEVLADAALLAIRDGQPHGMKGLPIAVPVPVSGKKKPSGDYEFEFVERIGRFGWKCQEASLINFSAGAYLNEMGVTSPLQPKENTSNGRDVEQYDLVADPEDKVDPTEPENATHPFGDDVRAFTRFMRSSKAPPRDFAMIGMDDVKEGEKLFRDNDLLGCAICHVPDHVTPPGGTPIQALYEDPKPKPGSDMATVPFALGNKVFHPYSDFLLHDVGTGDGIAQTQHAQKPPKSIEKMEKAPDEALAKKGIGRVRARAHEGNRRVLGPDVPGLDQRTVFMIRTAPLWGLRARPQLLHDGSALNLDEAIRRHLGQAEPVTKKYIKMATDHPEKARQLLAFLKSL